MSPQKAQQFDLSSRFITDVLQQLQSAPKPESIDSETDQRNIRRYDLGDRILKIEFSKNPAHGTSILVYGCGCPTGAFFDLTPTGEFDMDFENNQRNLASLAAGELKIALQKVQPKHEIVKDDYERRVRELSPEWALIE